MNNQYEIQLEKNNISDWYVDQSGTNSTYGDRNVSSFYTPYGIKAIDTQYCQLIRNIHNKIKQVYAIKRRQEEHSCDVKTHKVILGNYKTFYDPIELSQCNGYIEIRVEWENGNYHDFYYGRTPMFDLKTKNTNPEQLRKWIKECPNLHVNIKENLLENLDNYMKLEGH